jgi:glycine cleavage system regulatory protein
MVDGMPNPNAFLKVVDDLIVTSANRTNREPVRVSLCGECASILWAEGKADAAIRLEELWNTMARTHDLEILCGYSLESVRCDEDSYTFRRICEEHSVAHSW